MKKWSGMPLVILIPSLVVLGLLLISLSFPLLSEVETVDLKLAFRSYRDSNLEVYTVNLSGSELTNISNSTFGDSLPSEYSIDQNPTMSPDGELVAYDSLRTGGWGIWLSNSDGTNQRLLTPGSAGATQPNFGPGSTRITYSQANDIWTMSVPADDSPVTSPPFGSNRKRVVSTERYDTNPIFSPDGASIAFLSRETGNSTSEIFIVDENGENLKNLTNDPAMDFSPVFSADGQRIVFQSNRDGSHDLYIMDSEDGGNLQNLTNHSSADIQPSFSPDGQRIAFSSNRDGVVYQIYSMDTNGENLDKLTNGIAHSFYPLFVGDGSMIAFIKNGAIWKMTSKGKYPKRITEEGSRDAQVSVSKKAPGN